MILTNCAACAAPLAHNAPRCVRCKVRYCDSACQHDHWRRGHKQMCKKIHRGGNAEQYHADKKYKEAVAVAVKKCAADTKGQTCFICTQAIHWKTKEGLVRGCACRGTAGFAHVSCLAEQAKILVAEALENNLASKVKMERFKRWDNCSLCEQRYHSVVACAMGWACWKTYLGGPEGHWTRMSAMRLLGNGLNEADALPVMEAQLAADLRLGVSKKDVLATRSNIANCLATLGRSAEALAMEREIYDETVSFFGANSDISIHTAYSLAASLLKYKRYSEGHSFARARIPEARKMYGAEHIYTLNLRSIYARCKCLDENSGQEDKIEARAQLEDVYQIMRRVLGNEHPDTVLTRRLLAGYFPSLVH